MFCGKTGTFEYRRISVTFNILSMSLVSTAIAVQRFLDTNHRTLLRGCFVLLAKLIISFHIATMLIVKNC